MPPTDAGTDADAVAEPMSATGTVSEPELGVPTGTESGTRPGIGPGAEPSAESVAESGTDPGRGAGGTDCEDTLDLRLPDELLALFSGTAEPAGEATLVEEAGSAGVTGDRREADGAVGGTVDVLAPGAASGTATAPAAAGAGESGAAPPFSAARKTAPASRVGVVGNAVTAPFTSEPQETVTRRATGAGEGTVTARAAGPARDTGAARLVGAAQDLPSADRSSVSLVSEDLLDDVAGWGPATTPVGVFHLMPVCVERDLPLISRWMNDPAVAAFWELAGFPSVTEAHLRPQLDGDGRSVPCLGVLDGTPMSYWEIYRADLDPLARHYPARPHDTGIHLLIGGVADRGRGLGTTLLRAVADLVLDRRPACARVVAEPDLRNTPSVSAFLSAGFRFSAEVDLPEKRAALMVRDRALRDLLQPDHP